MFEITKTFQIIGQLTAESAHSHVKPYSGLPDSQLRLSGILTVPNSRLKDRRIGKLKVGEDNYIDCLAASLSDWQLGSKMSSGVSRILKSMLFSLLFCAITICCVK